MENNEQIQNPTEVGTKQEKLSYEQLFADNQRLIEIRRQLVERMQMMDMSNMFKRLDILFKVVENSEMFHHEFVEKCVNEIEELVTIPEQPQNSKEPEKTE